MFTIKHIVGDGGESLTEVDGPVTYQPLGASGQGAAMVYWATPEQEMDSLEVGTVYVMNKFGSTVAKYELGGRGLPLQNAA